MPNIRWIGADFPLHMSDFPSDSAPAPRLYSIFPLYLWVGCGILRGCLAEVPLDDAQRISGFARLENDRQDIQDKQDRKDKQHSIAIALRRVRSSKVSCKSCWSC